MSIRSPPPTISALLQAELTCGKVSSACSLANGFQSTDCSKVILGKTVCSPANGSCHGSELVTGQANPVQGSV